MSIKVRYFASLKEKVGRSEDTLTYSNPMTVYDVWHCANIGTEIPENILAAVNMDYASLDFVIVDGDEVAFFPPVTGG
ncbi:MAG: MoaD/ThiS family protein [Methylococcales bacterium]|nr:MoaD/ThiS family protein [Methylococcales bacterium]